MNPREDGPAATRTPGERARRLSAALADSERAVRELNAGLEEAVRARTAPEEIDLGPAARGAPLLQKPFAPSVLLDQMAHALAAATARTPAPGAGAPTLAHPKTHRSRPVSARVSARRCLQGAGGPARAAGRRMNVRSLDSGARLGA